MKPTHQIYVNMASKKINTAKTGKAVNLARIESAMKTAESNRAALEKLYAEKHLVASSGPWEHLHNGGLWNAQALAAEWEQIKAGKSKLSLEDQIYLREMFADVDKEEE